MELGILQNLVLLLKKYSIYIAQSNISLTWVLTYLGIYVASVTACSFSGNSNALFLPHPSHTYMYKGLCQNHLPFCVRTILHTMSESYCVIYIKFWLRTIFTSCVRTMCNHLSEPRGIMCQNHVESCGIMCQNHAESCVRTMWNHVSEPCGIMCQNHVASWFRNMWGPVSESYGVLCQNYVESCVRTVWSPLSELCGVLYQNHVGSCVGNK